MTEKELISKLQTLKQITPRKDWVFSVKMEMFGENAVAPKVAAEPRYKKIFGNIFSITLQKKLAYSFATLLLMFAGVFGFAQYTLPGDPLFEVKKITEHSQSALTGESNVKSNVETFKKRSHDLAEVVKNNKDGNKASAVKEVKDATKSLAAAIEKDSNLVKEVALEIRNNQTLLAVLGEEDLKESSDILYKAIDSQMIADLEKITLTEEQVKMLEEIKVLFKEEKYLEALEKILLINEEVTDIQAQATNTEKNNR